MSFDLKETIREAVRESDSTGPHAIAQQIAESISSRHLRQVVRELMHHAVMEVLREGRSQQDFAAASGSGRNGKRAVGAMTSDPMRMQYPTASGWKHLGDLTADDCDFIADGYEARAQANATRAKEFRRLAEQMRRDGAATLRDLGVEVAA